MRKPGCAYVVGFLLLLTGCADRPQWVRSNNPEGGPIICLAAGGPDLFAGTGGQGVFVSSDQGRSWTSIGLKVEWVTALAVNGSDLFAGTGEHGVFRSSDRGAGWSPTGLTKEWITALAVSGSNLFAGIYGGGVSRSTNGGLNWTAVNSGLSDTYVNALVASGPNLFAGTWQSGVFLSNNNGDSWTEANQGLWNSQINALAVSGRSLFAGTLGSGVFVSSNNGAAWTPTGLTSKNVYALAAGGMGLLAGTWGGGVLLSTDQGASWDAVNNGLTNANVYTLALIPHGKGGESLMAATQGGVFLAAGKLSGPTEPVGVKSPPGTGEPNHFAPVKTIRAARVLDGRGGVIENGVIEVLEHKIVKIDQRTGPVTFDLGPATVLPGLIDVHVHLTMFLFPDVMGGAPMPMVSYFSDATLDNARATLLAGFTTVQSGGGENEEKQLRDAIEVGIIVGPRLIAALETIWPEKETPEELRALVRRTKAAGADVVKLFTSDQFLFGGQLSVTQAQADAVCAEAKAQGLRCIVHAHSPEAILVAVKAGCTEIEHGFFADDAAIAAMAKANVYFDPNIGAAVQVELENQALPPAAVAKIERQIPLLKAMFRKALAAGLRMSMGTDMTGGGHGQNAREIIARVEAGQKPMDAIIGATSLAAESLRLDKTIGTLAPGYEADIIAVGGDPIKNIAALRDVTFVMKGGAIYKH